MKFDFSGQINAEIYSRNWMMKALRNLSAATLQLLYLANKISMNWKIFHQESERQLQVFTIVSSKICFTDSEVDIFLENLQRQVHQLRKYSHEV